MRTCLLCFALLALAQGSQRGDLRRRRLGITDASNFKDPDQLAAESMAAAEGKSYIPETCYSWAQLFAVFGEVCTTPSGSPLYCVPPETFESSLVTYAAINNGAGYCDHTGTCAPIKAVGEACSDAVDLSPGECSPGSQCKGPWGERVCVRYYETVSGSNCSDATENTFSPYCANGNCDYDAIGNKWCTGGPVNSPCIDAPGACLSGFCYAGYCTLPGSCASDSECGSDAYASCVDSQCIIDIPEGEEAAVDENGLAAHAVGATCHVGGPSAWGAPDWALECAEGADCRPNADPRYPEGVNGTCTNWEAVAAGEYVGFNNGHLCKSFTERGGYCMPQPMNDTECVPNRGVNKCNDHQFCACADGYMAYAGHGYCADMRCGAESEAAEECLSDCVHAKVNTYAYCYNNTCAQELQDLFDCDMADDDRMIPYAFEHVALAAAAMVATLALVFGIIAFLINCSSCGGIMWLRKKF